MSRTKTKGCWTQPGFKDNSVSSSYLMWDSVIIQCLQTGGRKLVFKGGAFLVIVTVFPLWLYVKIKQVRQESSGRGNWNNILYKRPSSCCQVIWYTLLIPPCSSLVSVSVSAAAPASEITFFSFWLHTPQHSERIKKHQQWISNKSMCSTSLGRKLCDAVISYCTSCIYTDKQAVCVCVCNCMLLI